jgi:HK97 gp10 family phage protein
MAASFKFQLSGQRELEEAFKQLPASVGKGVIRTLLRNAAKPIVADANANAPVDPNRRKGKPLKGSVRALSTLDARQRARRVKAGDVEVFVGPVGQPEAHLIEYGTAPRFHKSGKYVGQVTANPFMRRAWDANKERAAKIIQEGVWDALKKAAARLAKRAESGKISRTLRRQLGG